MSQHIVVGVDGSEPSLHALDWAAAEAVRRRTRLLVLYALAPIAHARLPRKSGAAVQRRRRQRAEETLSDAVARARGLVTEITEDGANPVEVTGEVRDGDPAPVLLAEAGRFPEGGREDELAASGAEAPGSPQVKDPEEGAAMVVVGGRGRGGISGMLLGSVSLQVASHAACPVAVVRGKAGLGGNIAVGVDGSRLSLPAVHFACEEARLRGAAVQAIHCWMYPVDIWPWAIQPLAQELADIEEEERRRLRESLAECAADFPDVPRTEQVVQEDPVHALVSASSRTDLLVVGSRGRGGFAGLVLGSVSHGVLHHAHCPVVVVRDGRRP